MKVLLLGMGNRVFMPDLRKQLSNENIEAEMLDFLEGCYVDSDGKIIEFGKKITSKHFLKKNLQLIANFRKAMQLINKKSYDVCNIHFLDVRYYFFKRKLLKLADKLVISIYGSDFYKYRKYSFLQKPFYKKAQKITFSNDDTLAKFDSFFDYSFTKKLYECRFGVSNIEFIKCYDKSHTYSKNEVSLNFPTDKILITVGYHSNPITQHIPILQEILKLSEINRNKIHLILPMAYGGFKDNVSNVENLLRNSGLSFFILKEFLNPHDIAHLRISSDVMIHLPVSDQLSATMLEYLYAGNYVITGNWLPYNILDKEGVYYKKIETITQLNKTIEEYFENKERIKESTLRNKQIIYNFTGWDKVIHKWIAIYNS